MRSCCRGATSAGEEDKDLKVGIGRNDHERLMAKFAAKSFSFAGLFHPNQWKNGREFADLVLKVGRSLFVFNMYEGRQWFESACLHNLDQVSDRITDWRSGLPIRGANNFRDFHIRWDDIDNIAVVSIVDVADSGCCFHEPDLIGHRDKLACAVTISGDVLRNLASKRGGARELVLLCSHLCASPGRIASSDICDMLASFRDDVIEAAWQHRPVIKHEPPMTSTNEEKINALKLAHQQIEGMFLKAGEKPILDYASDCLCQMGWYERASIASIVAEVAPIIWRVGPGETGPQLSYCERVDQPFRFGVGVGTSAKLASEMHTLARRQEAENLAMQYFFTTDFNSLGGIVTFLKKRRP